MARQSTKTFGERMFSGSKLQVALSILGRSLGTEIPEDKFLAAYDEASPERKSRVAEAQAEIARLRALLAEHQVDIDAEA